jgi:hypothetical protein
MVCNARPCKGRGKVPQMRWWWQVAGCPFARGAPLSMEPYGRQGRPAMQRLADAAASSGRVSNGCVGCHNLLLFVTGQGPDEIPSRAQRSIGLRE